MINCVTISFINYFLGHCMIYITIPKATAFRKIITATPDEKGVVHDKIRDCFVNPETQETIELQEWVKDALRTRPRNAVCVINKHFTVYFKLPIRQEEFLAYAPNNNGKDPTLVVPQIIKGATAVVKNPVISADRSWIQSTLLSPGRLAQVTEKRNEQRENRRHTGDSPLPT